MTYFVKSQISGDTLLETESAQEAKEFSLRGGTITWGKSRIQYPRRYVEDEGGIVVYAYYPSRPEYNNDLLNSPKFVRWVGWYIKKKMALTLFKRFCRAKFSFLFL